MCFSAKASFVVAGTLSVIGLLSTRKALHNKKLIPLASTPLIFAIQQISEGVVWISFNNRLIPSTLHTIGTHSFVFFAGTWWPIWVPYTLYYLESDNFRKKLLVITLIIGFATGITYLVGLLSQPINAFVINHHIYYPVLSYPLGSTNTIAQYIESLIPTTYLAATVIPFFLSTIRYMWAVGIIMGLACLTSQLFFPLASASIWCFFAAIISGLLYIIVAQHKKQ